MNREIFYNSVEEYLWFFGIIFFVIVFGKWISHLFGLIIYRIFRRLSVGSRATQFVKMIQRPLTVLIVLATIGFAFNILEYPDELNVKFAGISVFKFLDYLYRVLWVAAVAWLFIGLVNFVTGIFQEKADLTESKSDDQIVLFLKDFLRITIVLVAFLFILGSVLKFNITSLLAGAGIAGLAIALAAKEPLENLFGSFMIFVEKPFQVGDLLQVGEVIGTVEKVGFRSTRIRTLEKTFVTLPNRKIMEGYSENLTMRTFRSLRMMVGVTYNTNNEQIQAIVKDIQDYIDNHELTNEDGIVGFYEFGESSKNILVNYFVQNIEWNTYIRVREEINHKIVDIVEKHQSDFAFPTRTLHLFKEN